MTEIDNGHFVKISNNFSYFPKAQAILGIDSSTSVYEDFNLNPLNIGKFKVAPWGGDNLLPQTIRDKVSKSEIVGANILFNRNVGFGLGPKLVKLIKNETGKIVDYVEIDEGAEYDFFQRNDIPMYVMESLTDMSYFDNAFCELIPYAPSKGEGIYSIRNKEAMFSRWGLDSKGEIIQHLYSSNWEDKVCESNIAASHVVDEFNALSEINMICASSRRKRMVMAVYMPCPGKPYYSIPSWYSIFASGWYDQSIAIPQLKKAIMQHNLGVRYIIYVSNNYFLKKAQEQGINPGDIKAMTELKEKEVKKFNDFLAGADNAGKVMTVTKEFTPAGNSKFEEKMITIEAVPNKIEGGEYIADVETSASVICYATNTHPSLIGAALGKNSGSMSGTDKRELFLMKQALQKPVVDRVLRPLSIVKQVNKWQKDYAIMIPEYIFTTLDQNKTGKQESTTNTTQ